MKLITSTGLWNSILEFFAMQFVSCPAESNLAKCQKKKKKVKKKKNQPMIYMIIYYEQGVEMQTLNAQWVLSTYLFHYFTY